MMAWGHNIYEEESMSDKILTLTKDLIIPAGTPFVAAPTKTERIGPHYEALVSEGKDSVAHFTCDEDFIAEHAPYFA